MANDAGVSPDSRNSLGPKSPAEVSHFQPQEVLEYLQSRGLTCDTQTKGKEQLHHLPPSC